MFQMARLAGAHECPIVEDNWIREQDTHTEHNQERSSGSGYKPKSLEKKAIRMPDTLPSEIVRHIREALLTIKKMVSTFRSRSMRSWAHRKQM
jgi:hypothetical protein